MRLHLIDLRRSRMSQSAARLKAETNGLGDSVEAS